MRAVCPQTALAVSLEDPLLLGKQGALKPPQNDSAITAMFLHYHSLMLSQQRSSAEVSGGAADEQPERQHCTLDSERKGSAKEPFVCCMCHSCRLWQPEQKQQHGYVLLPCVPINRSDCSILSAAMCRPKKKDILPSVNQSSRNDEVVAASQLNNNTCL